MNTATQPQWQQIPTHDDYCVPVQVLPAAEENEGSAAIIILPALGLSVYYYTPLAKQLQAAGHDVYLAEQRGHGESAIRPSRTVDYGFKENLHDIAAVVKLAKANNVDKPVYLLGHSLGGHLATMYAGWRYNKDVAVDGVILVACGTPWIKVYSGSTAWQLRFLYHALPISHKLFGYYPGDRFGFGGREARTMMSDWRELANSNRYIAKGMRVDFDTKIARYSGRVLTLRMTKDDFAPSDAVAAVWKKFKKAPRTHRIFDEQKLGATPDHFRWARQPEAISKEVDCWVRKAD